MAYNNINNLSLECTCTDISIDKWNELMHGTRRASKRQVNRLVRKFLPELYEALALWCYNPYSYYRTDKHLILVHSAIEYFLAYD